MTSAGTLRTSSIAEKSFWTRSDGSFTTYTYHRSYRMSVLSQKAPVWIFTQELTKKGTG